MSLETLCNAATFASLPLPFGTELLAVEASASRYNATVPTFTFTEPTVHLEFDYCNVTVSYTHPGQADAIFVEAWLPAPEAWNTRLLGVGGGGFAAGRTADQYSVFMAPSVSDGWAAVTTDAGVVDTFGTWGLLSPGNLHLVNLDNFGGRALEEQGLLGKSLAAVFYGTSEGPTKSYFNGCSQGGRQGLALAQRYPTLYDGIFANAPGLSMSRVIPSVHWAQQTMVSMEYDIPHECEIDAVVAAAIAFCDGLDGVVDGIVAENEECLASFDPFSVVGQEVSCAEAEGGKIVVGAGAATVANETWHGLSTSFGQNLWPGYAPSADLTGNRPRAPAPGFSIANTDCSSGTCVGVPFPLTPVFIQYFLARDPTLDVASLTQTEFDELVRRGIQTLGAMDDLDTDMGAFRRAGGKMITFHGVDDAVVPLGGTTKYYRDLSKEENHGQDIQNFYRVFNVPGLAHCFGGNAGYPTALLDQLAAWVENGTAPDSSPVEVMVPSPTSGGGNSTAEASAEIIEQRVICPFPKKSVLGGGGEWVCQ